MSTSTIQIQLSPRPGFCFKTSTLPGALVSNPSTQSTQVPEGIKVFVNVAWDPDVPPSPPGSEDVILRTIQGDDVTEDDTAGFYTPAIVSSAREDRDKAGNPSLVFDCVYNTSIKALLVREPEIKLFLIELSLQRIETQTGLILSRDVKMPNISSKGKLLPRTAEVAASLLLETPLEEAKSAEKDVKGKGKALNTSKPPSESPPRSDVEDAETLPPLIWSWTKDGQRIKVEISTPDDISSYLIQSAVLDIEPRRIRLLLPDRGLLDIDLELSDAEISAAVHGIRETSKSGIVGQSWVDEETMRRLTLNRERDFDVENADAQWVIGARTIVINL